MFTFIFFFKLLPVLFVLANDLLQKYLVHFLIINSSQLEFAYRMHL